jgi:hypothetical protein
VYRAAGESVAVPSSAANGTALLFFALPPYQAAVLADPTCRLTVRCCCCVASSSSHVAELCGRLG